MARYLIEADGGSRGNPGPAGSGTVVFDDNGARIAEFGRWLGVTTNNVAEYQGMLDGVRWVFQQDPAAEVTVRMDSKLVVEQMSGRWKIKHPEMQRLAAAARAVIGSRRVTFEWVARAQNPRADAMANKVMDARASIGVEGIPEDSDTALF